MIKTQLTILPLLVFQMFSTVNDFHKDLPVPVKLTEDRGRIEARIALQELNAPKDKLEKLTNGVYAASIATKIDPVLIASIIPKESQFVVTAQSNLGYQGLMQTQRAYMKWSLAEADIMAGALVLKEKFVIAKGDEFWAMTYYKGKGGAESQAFAKSQLAFYHKIKEKVNKRMKEREENV